MFGGYRKFFLSKLNFIQILDYPLISFYHNLYYTPKQYSISLYIIFNENPRANKLFRDKQRAFQITFSCKQFCNRYKLIIITKEILRSQDNFKIK